MTNINLVKTLTDFKNLLSKNNYGLSIIVMDFVHTVKLKNYDFHIFNDLNLLLASYEIIRSVMNSRIISMDIKLSNFICVNDPYYYYSNTIDKRFYIVDFGICDILDDNLYLTLVNCYKNKDYHNFFTNIYNYYLPRKKPVLIKFIENIMKDSNFNLDMNYIINDRMKQIEELLLDTNFVKIVQKSSTLNLEWIYNFGQITMRTNKLFFNDILHSSSYSA